MKLSLEVCSYNAVNEIMKFLYGSGIFHEFLSDPDVDQTYHAHNKIYSIIKKEFSSLVDEVTADFNKIQESQGSNEL